MATILILFALLGQLTGGMHLKSNMQCAVASTILFTGISLHAMGQMWTISATMAAILIIFFIAPSKYYPYMKLAAILLDASNFLLLSPALAFSFLAQSITLVLGKGVRS
ncbi:accessory gene regulator B family protein [Paenibacillus sp. 22594]|uniref:accessory gene regulator B family protein n=1 Tax=Paenibacillus sp. 22594 TaxID=3453947 RepID=UPI003F82C231